MQHNNPNLEFNYDIDSVSPLVMLTGQTGSNKT